MVTYEASEKEDNVCATDGWKQTQGCIYCVTSITGRINVIVSVLTTMLVLLCTSIFFIYFCPGDKKKCGRNTTIAKMLLKIEMIL